MNLPFFHIPEYDENLDFVTLDEDSSRHVVQVLRMRAGDRLNLTDGKGHLLTCIITDDHKKHCTATVQASTYQEKGKRKVSIAISLLKNINRFEWFLEKATEIGVDEIIPLVCERTEKEKFRLDRMIGICTSAMLQSQQVWMPRLHQPIGLIDWLSHDHDGYDRFIAHCIDDGRKEPGQLSMNDNRLICIGPEGDFTAKEISMAISKGFRPVTLGETRLRSETAGVVAATLLRHIA